ncbi:MAG: NifU family protein [Bacteroidetes bacterium]|nr:MAG: NifU family protein [Bacteroidota bacterium]
MEKNFLLQKVETSLNSIRPFLQEDGGDVKIVHISDDNVVEVEFTGNCKECTMSDLTFKNGIKSTILSGVPEIKDVKIIDKSEYRS